jgi:hypothetical protein
LITPIILDEEYRSLSSSGPNILLSTIFSNSLSLHSSLSGNDQISHPYKASSKI